MTLAEPRTIRQRKRKAKPPRMRRRRPRARTREQRRDACRTMFPGLWSRVRPRLRALGYVQAGATEAEVEDALLLWCDANPEADAAEEFRGSTTIYVDGGTSYYATFDAAVNSIMPNPGDDYIIEAIADVNGGGTECDLDGTNTGNKSVTLTADADHRWNQDVNTSPAAAIMGTHARMTGTVDCVTADMPGTVIVEYLELSAGSLQQGVRFQGVDTMDVTVRYCLVQNCQRGIYDEAAPGAGSHFRVHNNFIIKSDYQAIYCRRSTTTYHIYFNTAVNSELNAGAATGAIVFNAGAEYFYGNIVAASGTACFYNAPTYGDDNLSDDATQTSTGFPNVGWELSNWMSILRNCNPGEEDLRPTVDRGWSGNLKDGSACEAPWNRLGTGFTQSESSDLDGSGHGIQWAGSATIDFSLRGAAGVDQIESAGYLAVLFRMRSGTTFDDTEILSFAFVEAYSGMTGARALTLQIRRSGSDYQARLYVANPWYAGTTYQTITVGDVYMAVFRWDKTASPREVELWLYEWGNGTALQTASDTAVDDYVGLYWGLKHSGAAAGISGYVDFARFQFTSAAPDLPWAGTPYGDDATDTYMCGDYSSSGVGTVDIAGTARGSNWQVGAWQTPPSAAGGYVPHRRTYLRHALRR